MRALKARTRVISKLSPNYARRSIQIDEAEIFASDIDENFCNRGRINTDGSFSR